MRASVSALSRCCRLLPLPEPALSSGPAVSAAGPTTFPSSHGARGSRCQSLLTTARSSSQPNSPAAMPFASASPGKSPWWRIWPVAAAGLGLCVAVSAKGGDADAPLAVGGVDGARWVAELADRPGVRKVVSPGQMLARNPIRQILLGEEDHLFAAMERVDMVKELRCYYDRSDKTFHAVVQLGKDVCGYPSKVHGGLTAAIIDETLGGLMVSLWKAGTLGVSLPAVTARLEVDYCKTVPQNSLILCSAQVESIEGRKLWLRASVTDGRDDGTTYATARALFVVPGLMKIVQRWAAGAIGQNEK